MNKFYVLCYKNGQFLPIIIENDKTIRTEEDIKAIMEEHGVIITIINLKEWVAMIIKHYIDKPQFKDAYKFMLSLRMNITMLKNLESWEKEFIIERGQELLIGNITDFLHWANYCIKYNKRTHNCTTLEPYRESSDMVIEIAEVL